MTDWDDAFANAAHIPGADWIVACWPLRARAYRRSGLRIDRDIRYGPKPRNRLDLVWPGGACKGLVVFVHGGFWLDFGKSDWTHLAEGARAHGWAVALPSYTLAPEARISTITLEVGAAIRTAASLVAGPIRLAGIRRGAILPPGWSARTARWILRRWAASKGPSPSAGCTICARCGTRG